MKKLTILFLFAALAAFNLARAQSANTDTATRNFIIQASISGLQEINSGQLAAQKALDPQVKAFGSRMVADHSKAQQKLMQLAKTKDYQIPPNATGGVVPDVMLKNATGKDFDRIYVHMMVPDHRSAVALFQKYAVTGKDPDIKTFVQQTLPVLKDHLATITAIDNKLKNLSAK
jgi:putative membrane protein